MLVAKKKITVEKATEGKEMISPIVLMIVGLIKRSSPDRVHEEREKFGGSITSCRDYDYD